VRSRYKRQLIQLNMNRSGLYGLEWKTCDPYSLVDDSLVRANPATSAPSHICETWRNVAQTCLNIKEMGPERSRINVCDPIVASF